MNTQPPLQVINTQTQPIVRTHKLSLLIFLVVIILISGIISTLVLLYKFNIISACTYVIKTKNLPEVVSCQEETYQIDERKINFVSITYGAPQDCPAGCIYQHFSGVIDGWKIFELPELREDYLDLAIKQKISSTCRIKQPHQISVYKQNTEYKWKIMFTSFDSKTCILKGHLLARQDRNSYDFSLASQDRYYDFSNIKGINLEINNCNDQNIAEAVCRSSRSIYESDCSTTQNQKNTCLYFQAESERKLDSCDKIVDNDKLIDSCYYNIAIILKDPKICDLRKLSTYYDNNCRYKSIN